MAYVLIVIVLALVQYYGFGIAVSRARTRYGVPAPAMSGHAMFERHHRIHANTLEQLIAFLPAIWLFAQFVDPYWAAGLGAVYLTGRQIYYISYLKDPGSRTLGFTLSSAPIFIMLAGVAWEAIRMLIL